MKRLLAAVAFGAAFAGAVPAALAQAYPSRAVRFVLGFPAGTNVDVLARPLALRLSETFGQQFVVDNRAGANGIIGTELVAKAAPDGYTLLVRAGTRRSRARRICAEDALRRRCATSRPSRRWRLPAGADGQPRRAREDA